MLNIKFALEWLINYDSEPAGVIHIIEDVLLENNYKITGKTDDRVLFRPYGPRPLTQSEAALYINNGEFIILEGLNELTIKLVYHISYSGEIMLLCIVMFAGFSISNWTLLILILIFLQFLYRLKRIRGDAQKMMSDIAGI